MDVLNKMDGKSGQKGVSAVGSLFSDRLLATPILAAILTIIAGFSQSYQWGSTWQNMIITAQQLEKEFDIYLLTPVGERNFLETVEKLNGFVITETEGFFERMLGSTRLHSADTKQGDNEERKSS